MNKTIDTKNIVSATLLSVEEYEKYGEMIPPVEEDWWWLRSPGYHIIGAVCVFGEDGYVDDYGEPVFRELGVRPALQISNPESLNPSEKFKFGGQTFTYLGKGLALCDDIVGKCTFRKDWKAHDANDYGASDVKKYVDNWLEKIKEKEMSGLDEPELEEQDR